MGQSQSPDANPDARAFMDAALEAEKGGRMRFVDYNSAFTFRNRCYTVKKREGERNQQMYETDHPMFFTTVYHTLVLLLLPADPADRKSHAGRWNVEAMHDAETIRAHLGSYEEIT